MNTPGFWLGPTLTSVFMLGMVFLSGLSASGKDIDDTCLAAGQELDMNYRLQNVNESAQFFPLHNKCNALYDTVPGWVNPVLAFLALLTVMFLFAMASTLFVRVKSRL
jgi:hypothetical protein